MKLRNKKFAAISLSLLLGTSAFATVLQADTITKSLKATFNDIKVTFNGENKQPAKEPFMVDGTVFVSLRDAGQMTGNNVDWDSS
ncbi:MAG: stalk domain-containing protein, partial [Cellulosilyticaceae bacterium]